jgi:peptidyl-prolyl cis-trans isomerase B (cyclophilin B)
MEAREAARRAERKRTLATLGIIAVVVLIGLALIWLTVSEERQVALAAACDATRPAAAEQDKSGVQLPEPPQMALRDGDYTARIQTSCGELLVDLYEDRAPETVNNFVALGAADFYDGLLVFRHARSISALQTGAGSNNGSFQIGYTFADELEAAEEEGYTAGSLAMANAGPNTNGSQFFFTYADSELQPQYTKFGQVIEGLEALQAASRVPVDGESPTEKIYIESVEILLDGKPVDEILEQERARAEADESEDE